MIAGTSTLGRRCAVALAALLLAAGGAPATPPAEPEALLADLRAAELDLGGAVRVTNLKLDVGFATLHLREGLLFPARCPSGRVAELLVVGEGRIELEPPDEVEAGQLELFTGARRLDETFDLAVLAIANDAAHKALLSRPKAGEVDAATRDKARAAWQSWRAGNERRVLEVDSGMTLDALGERLYGEYFGGLFHSERLGHFVVGMLPETEEPLTLGQFVPYEVSEREQKKVDRQLERFQRQGRFLGIELEQLGQFDRWVQTARIRDRTLAALAAFEPEHYHLAVDLEPAKGTLAGLARLRLAAQTPARVVAIELHGDLLIASVKDSGGAPLPHWRIGPRLFVVLPAKVEAGGKTEIALAYHGAFFEDGIARKSRGLRDNTAWYPHAGLRDQATYQLDLRWPEGWDLQASGTLVREGEEGRDRWQERKLDHPAWGVAFAIGRFRAKTVKVGETVVTVALGKDLVDVDSDLDDIGETVRDSLAYYSEIFGPYPEPSLTVVTAPADLSQSLPGFVVLADVMMLGNPEVARAYGLEDRRSVIAHEIAHQWWGHSLGWASYRDQWISEALANYAALLWSRHRLKGKDRLVGGGPTAGWEDALTATLPDGRSVESLGPLVLGERLSTSLATEAYEPIVYRKGALVVDMMARFWGEDNFVKILGAVTRGAAGHQISTADFIAMVGKAGGADLQAFARQFIYGTGLPEVYYDYRIEQQGEKWAVVVEAEQEASYRFRYRVAARTEPGLEGKLDVARERVDAFETTGSTVVVPVHIVLADPEGRSKKDGRRFLHGRLLFHGTRFQETMMVDEQPETLIFDPGNQVFTRFWNRRQEPKRSRFFRGLDFAAAGKNAEARAAYDEALATPTPVPEGGSSARRRELDEFLDLNIRLAMARLELDLGHLDAAATLFREARGDANSMERQVLAHQLGLLEARLALLRGDAGDAFKLLRKSVLKRGTIDDAEGWLLLAIAAKASGHPAELERALEEARVRKVDVALLRGS